MIRGCFTFGLFLLLVFNVQIRVQAKTDGWTRLALSFEPVTALATAQSNPGTIYAGTASGSIFKIVNGIQTPLVNRLGARSNPITAIAINPGDSTIVYAVTADGLFKSIDAGISWMVMNPDLGTALAIVIDAQNPTVLYAAADALGLFKSTDGGANWTRTSLVDSVQSIAIHPQNSATVYAGTSLGVLKSIDGATSWLIDYSWKGGAVRGLAIDPGTPTTLYAGSVTGGVFKSIDGGVSWRDSGLDPTPVFGLVVDIQESSTVYAATAMGPFKSVDAGRNWSPIGEGLNTPMTAISGDLPLCRVYAAASDGVFQTDIGPVLTLHSNLCVGSDWRLVVSHAGGNRPIRLLGVSNGASWEIANWSTTNGGGAYTGLGNFPPYTEGTHQIRADVGGVLSNTISFTITGCRPEER